MRSFILFPFFLNCFLLVFKAITFLCESLFPENYNKKKAITTIEQCVRWVNMHWAIAHRVYRRHAPHSKLKRVDSGSKTNELLNRWTTSIALLCSTYYLSCWKKKTKIECKNTSENCESWKNNIITRKNQNFIEKIGIFSVRFCFFSLLLFVVSIERIFCVQKE